jgi:hypothetical protein
VAGGVLLPPVAFGFRNAETDFIAVGQAAHKNLSHQIRAYFQAISLKKIRTKFQAITKLSILFFQP